MKRAIVELTRGVYVQIIGAEDPRPSDLPQIRIDHGLVGDFLSFMSRHGIYSIGASSVGGGRLSMFFEEQHAETIAAWFAVNNRRSNDDPER